MYRLCGDNIDKGIKQRYMRVGKQGLDAIHYFHSYAVSNRVDSTGMGERVIPTGQKDQHQIALSLLPSADDDDVIRNIISILLSRFLVKSVAFFKMSSDGVVNWHIKHQFYEEMSKKSDVVSIDHAIQGV